MKLAAQSPAPRFGVANAAVRNARRLIGAGQDLTDDDLRVVIEERLEEAMDDPATEVGEWTMPGAFAPVPFTALALRLEGEPAVAVLVENRAKHPGASPLVCVSIMHRTTAERCVANKKWRKP